MDQFQITDAIWKKLIHLNVEHCQKSNQFRRQCLVENGFSHQMYVPVFVYLLIMINLLIRECSNTQDSRGGGGRMSKKSSTQPPLSSRSSSLRKNAGELSSGLLDLHSSDTELLPEVITIFISFTFTNHVITSIDRRLAKRERVINCSFVLIVASD